jgi:hypothetical protein
MPRYAPALQNVTRVGAKVYHVSLRHAEAAFELDVEQFADPTAASVAADQIITAKFLRDAARAVA